jgi:hypothetical protein
MKTLLSGTEIRWWFRSRQSDHLNALSYWLCVLLFSALLSLIFSALWRVHVAEQSRLRRASEDSDWLGDAPLKSLDAHRKTFLEKREELINRVRYGDQSPSIVAFPLRPAADIRERDGSLPTPGSMFGNPDVRVYPSFATFSPKDKSEGLTNAEKAVFDNFAKFVTSHYAGQKDKDPSHIERTLAAALGLSDPNAGTAPLDVPWIYVASKEGAIAVFPGTTVINESSWDTTSRPWFRAALGGDSQLFKKGLLEEDLLTVTYLDVLAKRPMLVRTYMYKFQFAVENATTGVKGPAQEFVICIDIFRDRGLAGVTPSSAGVAAGEDTTFVKALLPGQFGLVHYVTFGLSVLFFISLRWISTSRNSKLTLTRARELVGKVNVEDGLRIQHDELMMKENKIGIGVEKYALGKAERSKQDKNNIMMHTSVEKSRTDLRGCELWEVSQNISETWGIFGIRFESVSIIHVGIIRLIYTSEVLPEADWRFFNHLAFSETEAANLRTKLPKLLERNADLCEGSLSIPDQSSDAPTLLRAPDVPDWVRSVVNAKELLAVRQRRAYVRLNSERLGELYSKADVKAVMTSGYFEELLNHGHVDFLLKGKTISRIIALPGETAELNLSDEAWKVLADLMGSYLPASARRLQRVGAPISNQSEPSPVYDFVILDDSCVIVAHFISKAIGIDGASGKHTKPTYVVEGYMSWRSADIEFYRGLFSQLAGQAKALTLPMHNLEIIDERLGSLEAQPN